MEYQEHEELYLSLSRKELQGLCKQHGLPANRSNLHLARSLESFFKMKNLSVSPSEEASFGTSCLPESKHEEPINPPGGFNRDFGGECERRDVSEADNRGKNTHRKEKALETATDMVCAYPANRGTIADFGCSTTEADAPGIHPWLATDVQEIAAFPRLGFKFHDNGSKNVSKHLPELKNSHNDLLRHSATGSGISNVPLGRCRTKKFGECSPEKFPLSSNAISTPAPPSFQFFVRSDKGLNLYVDLNSSPLDWIKSLKDEVCIYEKPYCSKSQTLCHERRCLGDANEKSKALSTRNIETDLQTNGADRFTKSSLSSTVSEHRLSVAYPTGVNDGPSRSAVLTSGSNPLEISGYLGEGNQVASSSCITYSNLKNCMESDTLSCLRDGRPLLHSSAGVFFNMNQTSDIISEKGCLPLSNESQEKLKPSNIGGLENHSGSCQLSSTSSCKETNPLKVGGKQKDAATAHLNGRQILDGQIKVVPVDAMESANHLLDQQACGILRNSVPRAPTSIFTEELRTSISVKEKENSECSQSSNSVVESCKRSHSSEFPDEFQSKRQHRNGENQNGTAINLRQPLAKDSISDTVVLPRRSIRLVSK